MKRYPYILFNKTPEQLRRLGARGGRTYARNQRVRARVLNSSQTRPMHVPPGETVAEAIKRLDAQFPWLRGSEKRTPQVHSR